MEYLSLRISGSPVWSNSGDICALSDGERHLGHIVLANRWQAFDATKLNDSGDGYRYIGAFGGKREAKAAVESSVIMTERPLFMTA
jgi:hypothetical protein